LMRLGKAAVHLQSKLNSYGKIIGW